MDIKSIQIKNFRGYPNNVRIKFGNFIAFIGKNDAGKSTILDALDIFFNDSKMDKDDVNKQCRKNNDLETVFAVTFTNLPKTISIDEGNETTLESEYLLNSTSELEIIKKYKDGGKAKIFIKANHPTNEKCSDLLQKKNKDLKTIVESLNLSCNKTKNAEMRKAIWDYYNDDLQLQEIELEAEAKDSEIKNIWEKLQIYMPSYSLFKCDRNNTDKDEEIQDPLKTAVEQILKEDELQSQLNAISERVKSILEDVSKRTLDKIKEMNPDIANSLHPKLPSIPKWADVFKGVSITGDEDIPINKRGSGVKRLILLNFFRAEAERKKDEKKSPNIIYAIEEPETSQHVEHQEKLINALLELSNQENTQIIITTHSSKIVKQLQFENLKMVIKESKDTKIIDVEKNILPYPSLNEVAYLAFDKEASQEYHNELYGYMEYNGYVGEFKQGKKLVDYTQLNNKNHTENKIQLTLTEKIRHQIHHPENDKNPHYTIDELKQSIDLMRTFINNKTTD